ncbi:hypothetical protein CVIRNUC_009010 [Coccomyxa viridis]|uniref:Mitochondrial splicing suppressor 51-like C-terminal domain-containing protein n=1 Tax=Coccomyxa viridis TaxID=1274662 RepID=A0AAV1IFD2_9CHLO|nr:hypothetical protein CVIRNUC_009010 [Coccomyxa viridis]
MEGLLCAAQAASSISTVVLSTVLTLHAAITQCARAQPQSLSLQGGSSIVVHMAGVHKEVLQWPLLLELSCLLPSLHLHIVMVSPSLPDNLHRHASWASPDSEGSLRVTLCQGWYHDVASELRKKFGQAQLVFCPNAGLAAYSSWRPTLEHLLQPPWPPCFFTDYCEEAALRAADACRAVLGTSGSSSSTREVRVALNPWRSPLRTITGSMALPSCSNGFLISVL